jgi:hypothetical protein
MIFRIPPALGRIGFLHPPNPSVLLVLVLGGLSYAPIGRDVRELLVTIIGT